MWRIRRLPKRQTQHSIVSQSKSRGENGSAWRRLCVIVRAVSTPREKLQDKLVLDGRRSPILKKDEATRYRSACMRLSYLAQDRVDLSETAKHLAQRMSEPRGFDFVPFKRPEIYVPRSGNSNED